ncbi:hypothetical protein ACFQX6_26695 [Streptosporangium lutulentum]
MSAEEAIPTPTDLVTATIPAATPTATPVPQTAVDRPKADPRYGCRLRSFPSTPTPSR